MSPQTQQPIRPTSFEQLEALVGTELGPTEWHDVTQERVNAFADATGDHQWIHIDPDRAASTPLGGTIAHGLYTLSLGPSLSDSLIEFSGFAHSLNYGYNKVRFPAPVPVGARIRLRIEVVSAERVNGGIQVTTAHRVDREGSDKPVLVAEWISRVIDDRS